MHNDNFSRLEIKANTANGIFDPRGECVKQKALDYFNIESDSINSVRVLTVDKNLTPEEKETFQKMVTDPVTEVSSFFPLYQKEDFDWVLHVGWRPGVKDNTGDVTKEMLVPIIGENTPFNVHSSEYFVFKGKNIGRENIETIGKNLLSNDVVQNFKVISKEEWDNEIGIERNTPKVRLNHTSTFTSFPLSDLTFDKMKRISEERKLYLNPNDIPTIVDYFSNSDFVKLRKSLGLEGPTDVELEYTGQARSDHCNHNTFNGRFVYVDKRTGKETVIENLFEECIKNPTIKLAKDRPWVKSILWDNAGVAEFNKDFLYVVTGETHNSPSNMEAYGGSITGIVGIYRDPMGTGRGSKLIGGAYGFCVGPRDYDGGLELKLHPRQLQDGVIEGVKDGGNKSGIPTIFGNYYEEQESIGKSLVFVYAMGLMPKEIDGKQAWEKHINPGDKIIMCGGRVGKDGIHGVTAASAGLDEGTPAGHVQIGDPYTQKKMHDFLLEAREEGLVNFITDNGGGGLSSSVGEASRFRNTDRKDGATIYLDKVPLKYDGLDQWEILVSESQERMTVGVGPDNINRFMELSRKHDVLSTVIGEFNNTQALHIKFKDKTCGYIPSEFLEEQFPQWQFKAEWVEPEDRGLYEPTIDEPTNYNDEFEKFLQRPNTASKEWITRQYDHEVQGGSVIKPFVGKKQDVPSDATVIRPDLNSEKGIAITQTIKQKFSKIDAYHMITATIDEAVRNVLAVGGKLEHLTGIDNFCWPSIESGDKNPDASHKAAQLVRANWALRDSCLEYGIPLLSGKDSMYCDGTFNNSKTEKTERVSGLETMQFTLHSIVDDISDCLSCDTKQAGNFIYVIGETKNELGGSEYYNMHCQVGLNVPQTNMQKNLEVYKNFIEARKYAESVKVIGEGGLVTHLFQMAAGGELGMKVNLNKLIKDDSVNSDVVALYSGSTGRMIVEVKEENRKKFESAMTNHASYIGQVTENPQLIVYGLEGNEVINKNIYDLKTAWKSTHGDR